MYIYRRNRPRMNRYCVVFDCGKYHVIDRKKDEIIRAFEDYDEAHDWTDDLNDKDKNENKE